MRRYPHYLVEVSRSLRSRSTSAERELWKHLRGRKLAGLKFRRQQHFGRFIVDFYCPERQLAVELEGGVHNVPETREYDKNRFEHIETLGIRVLRIANDEVIETLDQCLAKILAACESSSPPLPFGERGPGGEG